MGIQNIFINNLKKYRKEAGFTQAQLATFIDKSFNYINGIECGVSFPPPEVIDQIAEVLKIRLVMLFDDWNCIQNIIDDDKKAFVDNLADRIYEKIKDDIKKDIYSGIEKVI